MTFEYQAEKLSQARSALMLPHYHGEEESIAECFDYCESAFHKLETSDLEDCARKWIETIKRFMDTTGIEADTGRWVIKAAGLSLDDRCELSRVVDELADWFAAAEDNAG